MSARANSAQPAPLFVHLDWHLFMHSGSAAKHSLVHAREHCSAAVTGFFGTDFCACATDAMQSIARTAINLVMLPPARTICPPHCFLNGSGALQATSAMSAAEDRAYQRRLLQIFWILPEPLPYLLSFVGQRTFAKSGGVPIC